MSSNWKEWAKFGATYGAVLGIMTAFLAWFAYNMFIQVFEFSISSTLLGAGVAFVVIGIIIGGALEALLGSFIVDKLGLKLRGFWKRYSVLALPSLIISILTAISTSTLALTSLGKYGFTAVSFILFTWLVEKIYHTLKWRLPE